MSIGREMLEDYMYEYMIEMDSNLEEGLWTTKKGDTIYLEDMSYSHLQNAMTLIGSTSPWYSKFKEELDRRDKVVYEHLMSSYHTMPEKWKTK